MDNEIELMNRHALKRFKPRDQLPEDLLKLLSLIGKAVLAYALIDLVFIFMKKQV
jgi:hypothetical protein